MLVRLLLQALLLCDDLTIAATTPPPPPALAGIGNGSVLTGAIDLTKIKINDPLFGNREVAYWVTPNGLAIIDGDIIYGTAQDLLNRKVAKRAFSIYSDAGAWPNAEVFWKYDSDNTENNTPLPQAVSQAIQRWQTVAPWLKFTKKPTSSTPINGVVTISTNACGGCNANVGYANGPRLMNLQQGGSKCPGYCGPDEATHEFGHVLGLKHEHQRPDRDLYLKFQCANVVMKCDPATPVLTGATCCNPPAGCCAALGNFAIDNSGSDYSGAYDMTSIMQYRQDAFSIADGTPTLAQLPPNPAPPLFNIGTLSTGDVNRVCKLYGSVCTKAKDCAAQNCPTSCTIPLSCTANPKCKTRLAPLCCFPDVIQKPCKDARARCTALGCDFLAG